MTPLDARVPEPTAVTLARMEGKLDNVVEKVCDLKAESADHDRRIDALQVAVQHIESDALLAARTQVDAERARAETARALKEADEQRVAIAKEKVDESNRRWSPIQRLGILAGIILTLLLIYLAIKGLTPAPAL